MLKISEFRKERLLTQSTLAENINMSVKKLGAWEQGRAEPCIDDLCILADYFDCTLDELIGRTKIDIPSTGKGLTPQENTLLTTFRQLDEKERQQAISIITALKI